MAKIRASAERVVDVEPDRVWAGLTDYEGARRRILTENYVDYHVEQGPNGAVTLVYRLRAGGREREYHMAVEQTAPKRTLRERDEGSSYTTVWTLQWLGPGQHTRVRLASEWESRASGINGFFERTFAPLGVRRIHRETLARLGQLLDDRQPVITAPVQQEPSGA